MNRTIGIDIGGTMIKATNGSFRESLPTRAQGGPEALLEDLESLIKSLLDDASHPDAISIGIPGLISPGGEIRGEAANIPGLCGFPLKARLEERHECPVSINNDVDLAALAEHQAWEEKLPGSNPFVFINIGTGLGGSILYNGKATQGINGFAAEFGHIIYRAEGRECSCGLRGCLEQYISGNGLLRALQEHAPVHNGELGHRVRKAPETINAAIFYEYLRQGDPLAREVHRESCQALAWLCSVLVTIIDPALIVAGGGIMNSADLILPELQKILPGMLLQGGNYCPRIEAALLGDRAGLTGAWQFASQMAGARSS